MSDKGFLKFDKETGLVVSSKQQILLDLINICKTSYGQDYVVDEGTEMYSFLDNLAFALSETGGAVKSLYDAFGFTMATGTPLDVLCSLAGISRKQGETDTQLRARYYTMLYTPSVATLDGLKAQLMNATITIGGEIVPIVDKIVVLNNDTNATKDFETRTVANPTVNGTPTEITATTRVAPHSICVIVDLNEKIKAKAVKQPPVGGPYNPPTSPVVSEYETVCKILDELVLKYKSLGCGISNTQGVLIKIGDSYNQPITSSHLSTGHWYINTWAYGYIVLAQETQIDVNINGEITTDITASEKSAIINQIKENLVQYLSSLDLGQPVMYSGIMSCIFKMYEQLGYKTDIMNISTVEVTGSVGNGDTLVSVTTELSGDVAYIISPYQYGRPGKITFTETEEQ